MLIVGLTGGIASGKSTIAYMFKKEGAYVIDIDLISREVVEPEKPAWQEIINVFGKEILNDDRTINRKKLGEIIFSDAEKRKKLEEIVHPKINEEKIKKIKEIENIDKQAIVIVDIPLLIETNKHSTVDKIVLVYVSPQKQVERLMKRDGFSLEEVQKRLASQLPIEDKTKYAHYIINYEETLEQVQKKVKEIFRKLKEDEARKQKKTGENKISPVVTLVILSH